MKNSLEWIQSFNLQYNNLLNGASTGINTYEISLYLTKAYKEIVNEYYTGFYSKHESLEHTERLRRSLQPLIISGKIQPQNGEDYFIKNDYSIEDSKDLNSYIVYLNSDTYRILEESGKLLIGKNEKWCLIKPERHDYYWKIKNNPFRSVDENLCWRLDINYSDSNSIEIISKYPLKEYRYRYLSNPKPIIVCNLLTDPDYLGMNLSIEGYTSEMNCILDDHMHNIILNRAVELATRDYKENNLNSQITLNDRVL